MWFNRSAAQRRSRFNDDELATQKENEIEASDFNVQQAKLVFMSGHIYVE